MVKSASKAGFMLLASNSLSKALNFIALFFCTPYLGPSGFGNLLIVGIFLAVFTVILDIGFEHYYLVKIVDNGADRTSFESRSQIEQAVFWIRLYSNLFLFFVQVGVSYALLHVFFEPPIDLLLRILALNYLFAILGRINEVRLKKQMDFGRISLARIVGELVSLGAKLVLVIGSGLGIIGWVIGLVMGSLVNTLFLVHLGGFRPKLRAVPNAIWKEVVSFAKHSWFIGTGLYIQQQATNILLKVSFPLQSVGYFQFAQNYSLDIQTSITSPQGQMLVPYVANNKHDSQKLGRALTRLSNVFLVALAPTMLLGFVFTDSLVSIVFGYVWLPAVTILRVFLLYGLARLVYSPCLSLLAGLGRMRESSRLTLFGAIITIISLMICWIMKVPLVSYVLVYCGAMLIADLLKVVLGLRFAGVDRFWYLANLYRTITSLVLLAMGYGALLFIYSYNSEFSKGLLIGLAVVFWVIYYLILIMTKNTVITELRTVISNIINRQKMT